MTESFKPDQNNNPKLTPKDVLMNREIDRIERDMLDGINTEFQNDFKKVKKEAILTKYLLNDLISYLKSRPEIDKRMSLDEFTDIINGKDGNFDPLLRDKINQFIDRHETRVNLERSLSDFISLVSDIWEENDNLLNPGKEKISGGDE
jgi:hypothetical protein